jgi:FkbM family methyltransferase
MEYYMANKWLDTTVQAYKLYFGEPTDPIIYEVGSRDGKDGIELAERIADRPADKVDHSKVILFEPNPPQAEAIRKAYPNAIVLEYAASNKNGSADFLQINGDNMDAVGSSSLDLNRRKFKPGPKNVITVQTRRLDQVMSELEHIYIDIMKIDAEGYTYEILEGLGDRLKDVMVLHLETEQGDGTHPVTNKTSRQVFNFMRDNGFLCYALEYEWGGIEDQVWVNAEALK